MQPDHDDSSNPSNVGTKKKQQPPQVNWGLITRCALMYIQWKMGIFAHGWNITVRFIYHISLFKICLEFSYLPQDESRPRRRALLNIVRRAWSVDHLRCACCLSRWVTAHGQRTLALTYVSQYNRTRIEVQIFVYSTKHHPLTCLSSPWANSPSLTLSQWCSEAIYSERYRTCYNKYEYCWYSTNKCTQKAIRWRW